MKIARWRIVLAGGAALLLAVAGIGLANAAAPSTPASPTGLPAIADAPAVLDGADADALLAGEPAAGQAGGLAALRTRLGPRVVHAEWIVDRGDAGLVARQLDRGTIASIAGRSLTIAEAGGRSVTVAATDATRVRRNRQRATLADLRVGDAVVVLSTVVDGAATATVVVVPAPRAAATPSATTTP